MDLPEELERKGFGITVKGRWLGTCFFADDIVLLARSGEELQKMLDVVGDYGVWWRMRIRFNPGKCGVLVVGQKKQKRLWKLGKETIGEVDEFGVWINRGRRMD